MGEMHEAWEDIIEYCFESSIDDNRDLNRPKIDFLKTMSKPQFFSKGGFLSLFKFNEDGYDKVLEVYEHEVKRDWKEWRDCKDCKGESTMASLSETRKSLEKVIEVAAHKLSFLDKFGEIGELEDESVLVFKKTFEDRYDYGGSTGKRWTYAAIKINNGIWYLTGSGRYPNTFTNAELIEFLSVGVDEVWVAKTLELLGS